MNVRTILLSAISSAAIAATAAHAGTVWDAVSDFSITNGNPDGAWTYGSSEQTYGFGGYGPRGPFAPYSTATATSTLNTWGGPPPYPGGDYRGSVVAENISGVPYATGGYFLGSLVEPGVVLLWPSQHGAGAAASWDEPVVRWTAPASGTYSYYGSFEVLQEKPTGGNAEIYADGTKLFSDALPGYGEPGANLSTLTPGKSLSFSAEVTLNAGDTLSFTTDNYGSFPPSEATGLTATIACISCGPPPPPVPAIATLSSTTVNFGTVRAGTPNVTARTTVTNTATGFPVDNLNATSATGLPTNVSVSGALPPGLASGQSGDIGFLLDTTNPGVVDGSATLSFTSTSALESLDLRAQQVNFSGTVTQLANSVLVLASGTGVLTGGGTSFQLDLGSIPGGSGLVVTDLGVLNDILNTSYGEMLGGSFSGGKAKGFTFSGAPFSGLVGGATDTGNLLSFNSDRHAGTFTDKLTFSGFSSYPGLPDQGLSPIVLTITATILGSAVPEPGTWVMMLFGLGGLGAVMRSRRSAAMPA